MNIRKEVIKVPGIYCWVKFFPPLFKSDLFGVILANDINFRCTTLLYNVCVLHCVVTLQCLLPSPYFDPLSLYPPPSLPLW